MMIHRHNGHRPPCETCKSINQIFRIKCVDLFCHRIIDFFPRISRNDSSKQVKQILSAEIIDEIQGAFGRRSSVLFCWFFFVDVQELVSLFDSTWTTRTFVWQLLIPLITCFNIYVDENMSEILNHIDSATGIYTHRMQCNRCFIFMIIFKTGITTKCF